MVLMAHSKLQLGFVYFLFFLNEYGSLYVESMRRHCNCLIICYVIILDYDHLGLCLKYMMKQSPL